MLQVLPSYQTLAMPTWALFMSLGRQAGAVEHGLRGALALGLGDAAGVFVELAGHGKLVVRNARNWIG